jgi:hypothetical protein
MIEERKTKALLRAHERTIDSLNELIDNEKLLARGALLKVMSIDPNACVAGGAPRDWQRGNSCNDIDIFFEVKGINTSYMMSQLKQALTFEPTDYGITERADILGWSEKNLMKLDLQPVYAIGKMKDLTCEELYESSNVKGVFETEMVMRCHELLDVNEAAEQYHFDDEDSAILTKKVQFIAVKNSQPEELFKHFDCSMNCVHMSVAQWYSDNDFWEEYGSTLYEVGKETNIIVFSEEVWKRGIQDNKAYKRFIDHYKKASLDMEIIEKAEQGPIMRIGNEQEMLVYLMNTHVRDGIYPDRKINANDPEERHYKLNGTSDLPF